MGLGGRELHVAVVGATGAIGRELVNLLVERRFPLRQLDLYASARSAGETRQVHDESVVVKVFPPAQPAADLVFFCTPPDVAAAHAAPWQRAGAVVIDLSGGAAPAGLGAAGAPALGLLGRPAPALAPTLLRLPTTAAGPLARVLGPLAAAGGLERVAATLCLGASARGQAAMADLSAQVVGILNGRPYLLKEFTQPLAFNTLPLVGAAQTGAPSDYEARCGDELRALLELPRLPVDVTALFVPMFSGQTAVVALQLGTALARDELQAALEAAPGVELVDEPAADGYPTPVAAAERDEVFVGRLRPDRSVARGFWLVASYDNLRLCALNALATAQSLVASGL